MARQASRIGCLSHSRRVALPGCRVVVEGPSDLILARLTELRPDAVKLLVARPLAAGAVVLVQLSADPSGAGVTVPARVESCVEEAAACFRVSAGFVPRLTADEFHTLLS